MGSLLRTLLSPIATVLRALLTPAVLMVLALLTLALLVWWIRPVVRVGDAAPLAASLARFATVPAVRDGRVLRAADPMLLDGPERLGRAARRLAELLHPGAAP